MCGCSPKIAKAGNKVSSAALRSLAVSVESCAKTTTSLLKAGFNVTPKSSRRTSSSIAVMTHTGALRGPGVSPVSSITPLAMLSQSSTNSTSGSRCTPRASSIVAGFRCSSSANEYRRSACHACERRRPTVHEKRYVTAMYRVYLHPAPSHRALEHGERLLTARYVPVGACLFCSQRKTKIHNRRQREKHA